MSTRVKMLLGVFAATIAFIATALPSLAAPAKVYSLTGLPANLASGATVTTANVSTTWKNLSPNGNSSINSLSLTIQGGPAGFVFDSSQTVTADTGQAAISDGGKMLTVQNMYPVKPGVSFHVNFTVKIPATTTDCNPPSVTWNPVAWTGSNLGGDTFGLQPSTLPTTTITPILPPASLTFDAPNGAQPAEFTKVGTAINGTSGGVKVYVTDQCQRPVADGTTVTMSIGTDPTSTGPTDHATLGGLLTKTTSSGVATFSDLTIDRTSSDYQLRADAGVATGLSAKFAISNTDPNCDPCEATFDNGTSTVSAPAHTVLIIETNFDCADVSNPIAGTVRIVPPTTGAQAIVFQDTIAYPISGPYPFCKTPDRSTTPHQVQTCHATVNPSTPPDNLPCVAETVDLTTPPILHSVLWIQGTDPIGRH